MVDQEITIVIPTYTNTEGLKKLIEWFKNLNYQVTAVDNKPDEEKKKLLDGPLVIYLPQEKNIGFASAINLAVRRVKTPYFVILNDDVEIEDKDLFEKMINFAKANNLSAVSPVLKNNEGKVENLGYRVLPVGRIEINFDQEKPIDGLTAACLLMEKTIFDKVGGFDERFFAYLEDVDLFLRLKKLGKRFAVDLSVEVIHNHMQTSSTMGNFKQKQDLKNWVRIIIKDWDRRVLLRYLPLIILERLRNLSGYLKAIKN